MAITNPDQIAAAVALRSAEVIAALERLSVEALLSPSLLEGWSRLTIACHLRYGARASLAMTTDALAGRETSFYPAGRAGHRPGTLKPNDGEAPIGVVASLREASSALDDCWKSLSDNDWAVEALEPATNADLGPTSLATLALLRLTEVEVHGADLDLGLRPWSDVFVEAALPMRIGWLPTRRSNNAPIDAELHGRWVLKSTNGPSFAITVGAEGISTTEGTGVDGDAVLMGSRHDLLAFMLGRLDVSDLAVDGDEALAHQFHNAFPAP